LQEALKGGPITWGRSFKWAETVFLYLRGFGKRKHFLNSHAMKLQTSSIKQ